ncbi:MAG: hypothetical protein GYB68_15140 [Chloroflexi bacterium]|nr:hypothetical protein [Chloroflexota bacterium]
MATHVSPQRTLNPERRAWNILLGAFAVFILLCLGAIYSVQWFIFRSMINMDTELNVSRGTVRVVMPDTEEEIAVTTTRASLEPGTVISTDALEQATITFADPQSGRTIAVVVVKRDSQIELRATRTPRFGLNNRVSTIEIYQMAGQSEIILLAANRLDAAEIAIITPHAELDMATLAHVIVNVTEDSTQAAALEGEVELRRPRSGLTQTVSPTQSVEMFGGDNRIRLREPEHSLVANPDFEVSFDEGWRSFGLNQPPGTSSTLENVQFQGRHSLLIDRSQSQWPGIVLDHGENGLVQQINQVVDSADWLEIRASFYVEEQSLSTCGVEGSECPLMIRMDYLDLRGQERTFIHGFYTFHEPALQYPLLCLSCRTEHSQVNINSWYTYESGNLFTRLPEDEHPLFIRELRFYASGHAFKVYISEVDLLVATQPRQSSAD